MTKTLVAVAFLGGLLAVLGPTSHAQPDKSEFKGFQPAPQVRKHYVLRHADPAATAKLLEGHFARSGVVSPTSQGVLVTSSAKQDDIAQLIEEIDRPLRQVVIVVTLAEVVAKDQLADLKGTPDQVLARLDEMTRAGQATLKRVTLTGAEGQQVTASAEGNRPIFEGGAGPKTARAINYTKVGTTVKATSRVRADDAVAVDLSVQDIGARASDEEGLPVSIEVNNLTTRVTAPQGKAILAEAVEQKGKSARTTVVVVTARVADGK